MLGISANGGGEGGGEVWAPAVAARELKAAISPLRVEMRLARSLGGASGQALSAGVGPGQLVQREGRTTDHSVAEAADGPA